VFVVTCLVCRCCTSSSLTSCESSAVTSTTFSWTCQWCVNMSRISKVGFLRCTAFSDVSVISFKWSACLCRPYRSTDTVPAQTHNSASSVWSKKGNIITAALITIVQCNTLVARCCRQLISPADWDFVTLGRWDPYAVPILEAVAYNSYCNTVEWFWWDWSLSVANWLFSVLWRCWLGHLVCKNRPWNDL